MNELTIFNYMGREVRTVIRDGQPWWVARDVCEVLGLDPSNLSRILDDDEKGSYTIQTPGGEQVMVVINESGLWSMVLKSRKKEAKPFQKWVTAEVIPSIRKTGSYSVAKRDPITEIDRMAAMVNVLLPAMGGRIQEIVVTVESHSERLAAVEEIQRITDPREIEARMFTLHRLKKILVDGTKDRPDPVTYPGYWSALKERLHIASFQNRALLTVPMLDEAIQYATNWCFSRGVDMPSLFEPPSGESAAQ